LGPIGKLGPPLLGSQPTIIGSGGKAIPNKLGCESNCPPLWGPSGSKTQLSQVLLLAVRLTAARQPNPLSLSLAAEPEPINLGLGRRTKQPSTHLGPPLLGSRVQHHWVMLGRRTQQWWYC